MTNIHNFDGTLKLKISLFLSDKEALLLRDDLLSMGIGFYIKTFISCAELFLESEEDFNLLLISGILENTNQFGGRYRYKVMGG